MALPNQQVEAKKMSISYLTETNNKGEDDHPSPTKPAFVARKRQLSVCF